VSHFQANSRVGGDFSHSSIIKTSIDPCIYYISKYHNQAPANETGTNSYTLMYYLTIFVPSQKH